MSPRRRVAVIGAGVSGLSAAFLLRNRHDVVLYEAADRLGGHAHTHEVLDRHGEMRRIDSGFIVHNRSTYPNLLRLLRELDVQTRPTEMSMSISCAGCGLEYAGGRGVRGIVARPTQLLKPRFVRMLLSVRRFHAEAHRTLAAQDSETTFGKWLESKGFDAYFTDHFALPLVACVWSSGHGDALDYPALHLFRFLENHGMLRVTGSPQWYTIIDGSQAYVERIGALLPDVRLSTAVEWVSRTAEGVVVCTGGGEERFDHVVLATPADVAAELLTDATPNEREALTAFGYTSNAVVLHRDPSLLPSTPSARASWNYRTDACSSRAARPSVSYWMNRLHGLPEDSPFVVTLNDDRTVATDDVIARMTYRHPVFTDAAVAAQSQLTEGDDDRVLFAGAHLGWGFHEDGCRSGVEAARRLGADW